jgi:AcrR family transcriptional regulator
MASRRPQSERAAKARVKDRTASRVTAPRRAVPAQESRQAERRATILEAALAEFSERGFSAARLDDVARRAGIAKGTIYLYFRDKETLFAELIRTRLVPVVGTLQHLRDADIPVRVLAERLIDVFVDEVFATPRKDVIRLMIGEGTRFPKLAECYYREVLGPVMETLGDLLRRAHRRGEIADDALARFPQLLAAPGVVAIVWNGLFDRFAPLDVRALMRAHVDLILGQGPQRGSRQ